MTVRNLSDPARWLLRPIPESADSAVLCFPCSGVGASSYRQWPRQVADMHVVPLQPPGRENRLREPKPETHKEFADSLCDALPRLKGRPFGFFGHCGAVPYMLETIFELEARDQPRPSWMVASAWGAPHLGLYGALNFVDLESHDFEAEVLTMSARLGLELPPELVGMAASLLTFDQSVQRGYSYPTGRKVPLPVAVVGWSGDDIVPPHVTLPRWQEVATVLSFVLDGTHHEYLNCPPSLQQVFTKIRAMAAQ
ncbi:thioesterase II family protein [Streptomyces decoyicus]|uniref:thioesterase II family protein n=1 Tax=Streptomyces decoyicus TaxID=249567 RepID=UPI0033BE197F